MKDKNQEVKLSYNALRCHICQSDISRGYFLVNRGKYIKNRLQQSLWPSIWVWSWQIVHTQVWANWARTKTSYRMQLLTYASYLHKYFNVYICLSFTPSIHLLVSRPVPLYNSCSWITKVTNKLAWYVFRVKNMHSCSASDLQGP